MNNKCYCVHNVLIKVEELAIKLYNNMVVEKFMSVCINRHGLLVC